MNDALFAVLESWLRAVIPSLTAVVRGSYGAVDEPQPMAPYAAIMMRSRVAESLNAYRHTSNEADETEPAKVKQYASQRFQGTLVVNLYGEDALDLCGDLVLSLSLPSIKTIMRAADITIRHLGGIGNTSDLGDTQWGESAQVEFAVHTVRQITEAVPYIETVNVPLSTED